MRFEARTFWLPKDADETAQYQDAFALDAEAGRAAIADGVSSAIFSGPWARLLTLSVIAEPPPLDDGAAFQAWLADKRGAWLNGVDTNTLTWYQRPKMVDGAMTTLLWLELLPAETNEAGLATRYRLQTFAIGDTCLFHLREGELLYWFPLESSSQFGLNPAVIASVDRQLDHLLEFKVREHDCLPGDLLVLATDAVALWAVERQESGAAVAWSRYWDCSDEDWRAEIFSLRDAKQMRFDDSTLVLLRIIQEQPAPTVDYDELIGPDLTLTADEAPLAGEGAPAEAVIEGDHESVEVQPESDDDIGQTPVASLTEAVKGGDALRFDAPVDESIDALKQVAATSEGSDDEAAPVVEEEADDEADDNDHDPAHIPT